MSFKWFFIFFFVVKVHFVFYKYLKNKPYGVFVSSPIGVLEGLGRIPVDVAETVDISAAASADILTSKNGGRKFHWKKNYNSISTCF